MSLVQVWLDAGDLGGLDVDVEVDYWPADERFPNAAVTVRKVIHKGVDITDWRQDWKALERTLITEVIR